MAEYPRHAKRERRDESGAHYDYGTTFDYNDGSGVISVVAPRHPTGDTVPGA
jgi:hypothetical protein